jgi:hypothetical protein
MEEKYSSTKMPMKETLMLLIFCPFVGSAALLLSLAELEPLSVVLLMQI